MNVQQGLFHVSITSSALIPGTEGNNLVAAIVEQLGDPIVHRSHIFLPPTSGVD